MTPSRYDIAAILAITDEYAAFARERAADEATTADMPAEVAHEYMSMRRAGFPADRDTVANARACVEARRIFNSPDWYMNRI